MKIKYTDIPEQEIINLIGWFVKEKTNQDSNSEIVIHTESGDITLTYKKKNTKSIVEVPIACPCIIL